MGVSDSALSMRPQSAAEPSEKSSDSKPRAHWRSRAAATLAAGAAAAPWRIGIVEDGAQRAGLAARIRHHDVDGTRRMSRSPGGDGSSAGHGDVVRGYAAAQCHQRASCRRAGARIDPGQRHRRRRAHHGNERIQPAAQSWLHHAWAGREVGRASLTSDVGIPCRIQSNGPARVLQRPTHQRRVDERSSERVQLGDENIQVAGRRLQAAELEAMW